MSTSLWHHGLQHTRLPCPSPSSGACSNSCPLSQRYYPTILSSVIHLSSCLLSFLASRHFPMSCLFTSGGQSVGTSASATILSKNIQRGFPLGLTGLISLQFKCLSRVFSSITIFKASILWHSAFFMIQFTHPYTTTRKIMDFPDGSVVKNLLANAGDARDAGLISGFGKISCRRKWQSIPVFLLGKSRGERSLAGYSP